MNLSFQEELTPLFFRYISDFRKVITMRVAQFNSRGGNLDFGMFSVGATKHFRSREN